ncbi:MAG: glycosyltransferase family 2 protein [Candidatus Gorgyraea atricola]|nr:glycosyltransferase family 2 protein [Candidatus Gorgyraea atricola]
MEKDKNKTCAISLVMPAKNEEEGIAELVDSSRNFVDEIIVVDGHSSDKTAERASSKGAKVVFDNKKGKGDAYKVGIQEASGNIIVFMDADGSHDPAQIPALIEPLLKDEADFVIGSRHKGGSDEWKGDLDTYLRSVGGGFLTLVINYIWKTNLTECLNGFRAIKRDVGLKLDLKADDFDIEQHMIVQCLKKKFRVTEVNSHEYERKWGVSKLPTCRKAHLFFWRLFLDIFNL